MTYSGTEITNPSWVIPFYIYFKESEKNVFKEIQTNSKPKIENIYNQIIGDVVFEHFTVGMKELEGRIFQPYNTKLSFFARAKRCLKVNGVWGTFKKVVKKSLGKAKRILKKILCKNKNTSK